LFRRKDTEFRHSPSALPPPEQVAPVVLFVAPEICERGRRGERDHRESEARDCRGLQARNATLGPYPFPWEPRVGDRPGRPDLYLL